MQQPVLSKLILAKRLLSLGRDHIAATNDLSLSIAANLLQDAVEVFLLGVSEHLNAGVVPRTTFDQYFELINQRLQPKELPLKARLLALNKLRINSKHYGLPPAHSVIDGMDGTVREFFEDVTATVFNASFATLSLIDLLKPSPSAAFVREAEAHFQDEKYADCLIACRKAMYLRVEKAYDVARFRTNNADGFNALLGLGCSAPYFARNSAYIAEHVKEPTDYIVFDHNTLEMELLTSGMDRDAFWNVWRLTPQVYQPVGGKEWFVKYDLAKLEEEGIRDRAEYVLDATINLLIAEEKRRKGQRWSTVAHKFVATLARQGVAIYEKAALGSKVVRTTPDAVRQVTVDYWTAAIDESGAFFWHVSDYSEHGHLWGFIDSRDVQESMEQEQQP